MHTVDGRTVTGTEILLENQLTGSLEELNSFNLLERRHPVETRPLTLSHTIPQVIERENERVIIPLIATAWEVPNFLNFFSETLNNSTRHEQREEIIAFA
jgi:hypothetical protein